MGSLTMLGGLAGLGKGIAQYGAGMERSNQLEEERAARMRELEMREQAKIDGEERAAARATSKEERAAAAKVAAEQAAYDRVRSPGALVEASGGKLTTQDAAAFRDIVKNGSGQLIEADDGSGGQVSKYEPGYEAEVMKKGTQALFQALKLANPDKADDLASAQFTDYKRDAAERAEGGDAGAKIGALTAHGQGEFDAGGSSKTTGAPAKGSLDEAKVGTEKASQAEKRAMAGKHSAEAKKVISEATGALADGASKERLHNLLNSLNKTAEDMSVQMDKPFLEQINAARKRLVNRIDELGGDNPSAAKPAGKGITKAEYDKLPRGATYVGQDGKTYRKK